jgi:hypothetical protein
VSNVSEREDWERKTALTKPSDTQQAYMHRWQEGHVFNILILPALHYRHYQRCLGRISRSGGRSIASTMAMQSPAVERRPPSRSRAGAMSWANRSVLPRESVMQSETPESRVRFQHERSTSRTARFERQGREVAGAQRSVYALDCDPNSSPHPNRASNNIDECMSAVTTITAMDSIRPLTSFLHVRDLILSEYCEQQTLLH